jgi:hypothetical protein
MPQVFFEPEDYPRESARSAGDKHHFFPLISPMIADHSWQHGISAVSCGICGKRGRDAWRNGGHPPVVGESPPPLAMAIKEDADHGKFFAFPFSFLTVKGSCPDCP